MLSIHLEKVTDTQNRNIANVENNFDEFRSRIGEIKFLVSQSNELSENIKKLVILTVKDQTKEIIKSVKQEDEIFANKINKGEKQTSQYNANGKKEITNSDLLDDALNEQPQKEQQKQSQQQQPYLQQEMLEEMQGLRRQLGEMKNALKKSESKIEAAKKAGVISGVLTGALALCLGLIF
jgi:Mg2+ and Co2+ transporter CorA